MNSAWAVYVIENSRNGKQYVGITSKPMKVRFSEHVSQAFPGRKNPNGTLYALHAAIQKYGAQSFSIRLLEQGLNLEQARNRERYFIQELSTYGGAKGKRGYNQTLGGELPDEGGYSNHSKAPLVQLQPAVPRSPLRDKNPAVVVGQQQIAGSATRPLAPAAETDGLLQAAPPAGSSRHAAPPTTNVLQQTAKWETPVHLSPLHQPQKPKNQPGAALTFALVGVVITLIILIS